MIVTFKAFSRSAPALPDETVMDVARRAGVPLANSCGAVGVCGRCRVQLVTGAENLSPPTTVETRFAGVHRFGEGERMACQAVVQGDCEVTTTYW